MNEATAELERAYDAVPYLSDAFPQAHPDRLATVATLLGLEPAHPARCRVLELGCAAGGNLIPMAYGLPESEFIGIDLSAMQIEEGRRAISDLGLKNIQLLHRDLAMIGDEFGQFDYVIAHGIWSWVPPDVREAMFALCRRLLRPDGVAYISYNVLPGYFMFQMVRGIMQFHTRGLSEPLQRVAEGRSFMGALAGALEDDNYYGSFVKGYLAVRLAPDGKRHPGDAGISHDEMASINDPVYFWQFMEGAEAHGLQFLGEARFETMFPKNVTPELSAELATSARTIVAYEQYLDFLGNRGFRETLLCQGEAPVSRKLSPERVRRLSATSFARPVATDPDFAGPAIERFEAVNKAAFSSDHPLTKAAMLTLSRRAPRPLAFDDLVREALALLGRKDDGGDDVALLAANLTQAYSYSPDLVSYSVHQALATYEVNERPIASRYARYQASQGRGTVTSLRHDRVTVDRLEHEVLKRLDGEHDLEAVVDGAFGQLLA
ncbi:MAG: methyltransferase regulatory domain-containing protein, partial [Dehalococcoidia bacterium]